LTQVQVEQGPVGEPEPAQRACGYECGSRTVLCAHGAPSGEGHPGRAAKPVAAFISTNERRLETGGITCGGGGEDGPHSADGRPIWDSRAAQRREASGPGPVAYPPGRLRLARGHIALAVPRTRLALPGPGRPVRPGRRS